VILVDDHLLLRAVTGSAAEELASQHIATTTSWWWRAVAPIASPPRPGAGHHSRLAAALSQPEADAVWEALCRVGQADSRIHVPELVPLGPAMAWLARHEGLNRLAAEAVAAAMDLDAAIHVRAGNEGRLPDIAARYGLDIHVAAST
jgi:hypothetical protein